MRYSFQGLILFNTMGFLSSVLVSTQRSLAFAVFRPSSLSKSAILLQNVNRGLAVAVSDWTSRGMSTTEKANHGDSDDSPLVLDPLIVCGPSGVGKGTIIERYMSEEFGGSQHFGFTTSHTTRAPRSGEINTIHYNFVSHEDMKRLIGLGHFLEHAEVHGNRYGTSWDSLRRIQEGEKKRCLLDIDVQGVKRIKALEEAKHEPPEIATDKGTRKTLFKPKYIFIAPPSMELLEKRLIGRGTESAESLKRRSDNAKKELEYGMKKGNFDRIIINDSLDRATKEFASAVEDMYGF